MSRWKKKTISKQPWVLCTRKNADSCAKVWNTLITSSGRRKPLTLISIFPLQSFSSSIPLSVFLSQSVPWPVLIIWIWHYVLLSQFQSTAFFPYQTSVTHKGSSIKLATHCPFFFFPAQDFNFCAVRCDVLTTSFSGRRSWKSSAAVANMKRVPQFRRYQLPLSWQVLVFYLFQSVLQLLLLQLINLPAPLCQPAALR